MTVIPGNGQGFDGPADTRLMNPAGTSTPDWAGPTSRPITARTAMRPRPTPQ